jgi:septal ring factor EnvC (AmiA/AmiB activator)
MKQTEATTVRFSRYQPLLWVLVFCFAPLQSIHAANPVASSIQLQAETERAGKRSQQKIDQVWEETGELREQFQQTARELDSLRSYNEHMARMVGAQEQSIASLESQLDEVQITQRGVIPLLGRMLDSLAQFIELDRPFLLTERRQRVARLREMLDSPEETIAEKYRRVLEAYQVESEYGRTLESYRDTLEAGGGVLSVEFLRVGRIALLYRSLDGAESGVWDQVTRSWKPLPSSDRSSLKQGFRVAKKQIAPELLVLPVKAPELLP